jgi:hypothetical protein
MYELLILAYHTSEDGSLIRGTIYSSIEQYRNKLMEIGIKVEKDLDLHYLKSIDINSIIH